MRIFIRNLPWAMTEATLSRYLSDLGFSFKSVRIILDRDTGRSRGFAFVEFPTEAEASRAIGVLTGDLVDGRVLSAHMALRQEADRSGGDGSVPGRQDPRGADRTRKFGRSNFPGKEHRFKGRRSRSVSRGEPSDW